MGTNLSTNAESGAPTSAEWRHRFRLFIDALGVQPFNQIGHCQFEYLADAEQGGYRDGATAFHLLPVAGREPKREHVLLREAVLLAEFPDSSTQGTEELVLIRHSLTCKVLRAEIPRAD